MALIAMRRTTFRTIRGKRRRTTNKQDRVPILLELGHITNDKVDFSSKRKDILGEKAKNHPDDLRLGLSNKAR